MTEESAIEYAKNVIEKEMQGLELLMVSIGCEFFDTVKLFESSLSAGGKIVFTGIGKSAHISRKAVATLISTGSRAAFMYPVESMHGDLGMLSKQDVVVAVSYSGETDELLAAIPAIRNIGCEILALTSSEHSRLAKTADHLLLMPVLIEACPFELAPTTSTTALLALTDALALTLMKRRDFTKKDYGRLHPAGSIGRALTYKVRDVMKHYDVLPSINELDSKKAMKAMLTTQAPCAVLVNNDNRPIGAIDANDVINETVEKCSLHTLMIKEDEFAVDALKKMTDKKLDVAIIVDASGKLTGVVSIKDFASLKISKPI